MSPLDDAGNLIWNTIFGIWTPVIVSFLVYVMVVMLVPPVFHFIRCRNLAHALHDLEKRRSEMNTLSLIEPV